MAVEVSWQSSWRSSCELSGPFRLEISHFHVWCPQNVPNCSCERSFELGFSDHGDFSQAKLKFQSF